MLLDRLAERSGMKFVSRGSSLVCGATLAHEEVLLAKPQTYMNLSGQAVRDLVQRYGVDLSECLIAYDEVALPLGRIRVRPSGSSGGHKGIQSVIERLGTQEIPRVRIGIAGDEEIDDLSEYVLSRFRRKEQGLLDETLEACVSVVDTWISEGVEPTMARFN
jgi:PTH1 family peptidyl-tRNA hydrolase